MSGKLLRNAGCASIKTKAGIIVSHLDGSDELFRVNVLPAEHLLTDHKIIDAVRLAELSEHGLASDLRQIAAFSIRKLTKLIIHGIDQPIVNLDYHGWPVFEEGGYTVFAVPPVRPPNRLFLYAHSPLA